jgi:hypothetical protein
MRQRSIPSIGLIGTLAVVVLLAGCGSDDDTAATAVASTSETTTSTTEPTTEPTTESTTSESTPAGALATGESEASTTEAPVETDPPATEAPAPDTGECLVGDWVVTEEQMDAYYSGLMGTLEAPLTIDTVGSAPLSFAADGTYEWAPGFALTVEVAGATGTGDVSGTITGKWSAVDGVVTTFSDLNALVVSITVNGVSFDGADLANGLLNSTPINGVTYSCDGPSPVLDFQTADPAVTVPVTLTPA